MARPAIAAGVLLAIMETIADYGTVALFQRADLLDRHLSGLVLDAGPGGGGAAGAVPARLRAGARRGSSGCSAAQARSHMRGGRLAGIEPQPLTGAARLGGGGASARCRWWWASCCRWWCSRPWRRGRGRASPIRATCGFVGNSLTLAGSGGRGDGGRRGAGRRSARACGRGGGAGAAARRRARLRGAGGGDRRGAAGALRRARQSDRRLGAGAISASRPGSSSPARSGCWSSPIWCASWRWR